jgi:pimeloyl-ACP methyl ester carboxylesterase
MPEPGCWNGDLVLWAHGYVDVTKPVEIPEDQMGRPGGPTLPEVFNTLGFAFATTSYRQNGLVVKEGIEDLRELVDIFRTTHGAPERNYLLGGSLGGAITALSTERFPEIYDGGLAACGPVGDFGKQLDYVADFRVVFDYFFPGLIPGTPGEVPPEVLENWGSRYVPRIKETLRAQPNLRKQLLRVTHAPSSFFDPSTEERTVLDLLYFSVFGSADAISRLGGSPFDNRFRFYRGSANDIDLNLKVRRFAPNPTAVNELEANYQTSGGLARPLVTLHTTGDPVVPYWHERLYSFKAWFNGSAGLHSNVPSYRYGHCEFGPFDVVMSFALLVLKVRGQELTGIEELLHDPVEREKFLEQARAIGALAQPSN